MENDRRLKILIVDDERSHILALNTILKPLYQTFAATGGKEALDKIHNNPPDLVLLDIVMPGTTGFDVLTALKEDENTRKIPVIMITGQNDLHDEEKGLLMGAADYITKPFHGTIVCARIKTHLQITEFIRHIEGLGLTDPLTGLPNRRSFDRRFLVEWHRALREKEPLSILMLDIDHFKRYNDTHGHVQGDAMLQGIVNTCSISLKREIDFAARWGGEEFVVLLPNTDITGAVLIAESMRRDVGAMTVPDATGTATKATISVGVYTGVPEYEDTAIDFLARADDALYAAKHKGRNRVCVYEPNV